MLQLNCPIYRTYKKESNKWKLIIDFIKEYTTIIYTMLKVLPAASQTQGKVFFFKNIQISIIDVT